MTVAYPLVTGEININLMDYTVRKRISRIGDDQLFVTIPYPRMASLMESIEMCGAGTAKTELMPPKIMVRGKVRKESAGLDSKSG
jgi:uncharacterized protein (DUF169 family)